MKLKTSKRELKALLKSSGHFRKLWYGSDSNNIINFREKL